jgi:hypothetical protein
MTDGVVLRVRAFVHRATSKTRSLIRIGTSNPVTTTALIALAALVLGFVGFRSDTIDFSTFLGLFIPAVLGIFGSFAVQWRRRESKRTKLRRALLGELESMYEMAKLDAAMYASEMSPTTPPPANRLTTAVYDSNTDGVGLLTEEEIEAITEFYSTAHFVESTIEAYSEGRLADTIKASYGPVLMQLTEELGTAIKILRKHSDTEREEIEYFELPDISCWQCDLLYSV